MKCTNCGGELLFKGDVGICQACGMSHKLDNIFEKTEACLCYVEYDSNGRRTKDSILAQEVYRKLESQKVSVFYERISASNSLADELEMLRYAAINKAKIIIVIGTSKENFEFLTQKYYELFTGKRVIPFFADITPADIPYTLNKLQAVNYEKIGWETDLVTGVLNILGRKEEPNLEKIHIHARKKRAFWIVASILLCVAIGVSAVFLFFDKKEEKDPEPTETSASTTIPDETKPLTKLQIYENAAELAGQGKLLEAADLYLQILDYKDSQQLLDSVYTQYYKLYTGTYLTEDKKTMVTLDIKNSTSVEVTYKQNRDGERQHYSATTVANVDVIEFDGIGKIELLEEKIRFSLEYAYDPSLNVSMEFTFAQKGDPSEYDSGIRDELLSFFSYDTNTADYGPCVSVVELMELGYNVSGWESTGEKWVQELVAGDYATKNSYESNKTGEIQTPNGTKSFYDYTGLKNYHEGWFIYEYDEEKDVVFEIEASSNYQQTHMVTSAFAKASVLTPDMVGQKPIDFTENGVVYSFVNAGDVLQKDDWVNITSYNPDHLKEYNEHMKLVDKINSTDWSNEESVLALNNYDLTEAEFMLSNYKLGFYYYTNNLNGFMNHEVYEIIGTDYQVLFYFYKNGELIKSEIYPKGERIRPEILTYG